MLTSYTPQPPRAGGTYVLVMQAHTTLTARVGALGLCTLPAGWLLYVGSALGGLAPRLERHARRDKALHWHIDHVLQAATLVEAWCHPSPSRLECAWAHMVAAWPGIARSTRPIGASDCACHTHLFAAPSQLTVEAVFAALDDQWPLLRCSVEQAQPAV
ncbi:MAG: GIY-YIG nuclease family protein [Chloroflexi bacterium]|nr:GIY-YIG nuclease family protein [Chloroflexota bacterium]